MLVAPVVFIVLITIHITCLRVSTCFIEVASKTFMIDTFSSDSVVEGNSSTRAVL